LRGLFDYDLLLIRQHDFIVRAIGPQGFEPLPWLLRLAAKEK
jgi:hypothetical protein